MTADEGSEGDLDEGVTRRRFVQVCVGVATAAAVGSTMSSFLGLRPPIEVSPPPSATEAVAMCSVCSVGCGLTSVSSGGEPFPPRGDPMSSSTSGMICTRGALPPETVWPSTIGTPLRRISPATKGTVPSMDQFEPIEWDEAIADLAGKILENQSVFGKDSTGCILGGGLALEDAYVAGKLFKGALGSSSLDTVESLHSRTTERVLIDQLGEVASPTCLNDIGLADLIVVMGEDLATTHPVVYAHVAEAVASKGADLVVIDPRYTATAQRTRSVHVPVRAGGEVALLNAIGNVLVHEMEAAPSQWALDHSLNAAAFAEFLKLYSPVHDENERVDADHLAELCDGPSEWVAPLGNRDVAGLLKSFDVPTITGIDAATVRDLARRWNQAGRVLTIWSSRLAGAGDDGAVVSTALNLHLLTGQVGRPGAGPMGLQAHASGRGAVEAGASPITIPGAWEGGVGAPPALVEAWGEEFADQAAQLPQGKGLIEVLGRAKAGALPVLMLLGGSVSMQLPDLGGLVQPALMMAHVVVTAAHIEDPDVMYADVVLPRTSWYEREAHYISSERKVARSLPSMARLDGTRTEMEVLSQLGSAMWGGPAFDLPTATVAMDELRRATAGTPADFSSLPLGDELTESRGMQWPVDDPVVAASKGRPRRHMGQDGRDTDFPTPTGRALILPQEDPTLRRPASPDYPIIAVTSVDNGTWWDALQYLPRGGDVVRPRSKEAAYIEMTVEDAGLLGMTEGDRVSVSSAAGSALLMVRLATSGTALGHVFIPWGHGETAPTIAPSFPLDRNGVPPWTVFPVKVEHLSTSEPE